MMDFAYIVLGGALLYFGGEWLISGSVSIARKLGLSTLLVSTVIIGFGTSTPELLVSLQAALKGSPDIALGNVVGSNICNTLLILGVAALISTVACKASEIRRDAAMGLAAGGFLAGLSLLGAVDALTGFVMCLSLGAFIFYCVWREKSGGRETAADRALQAHVDEEVAEKHMPPARAALLCAVSLLLLVAGARFFVEGAVGLATHFGVSEAVIGLTLVAVGTSLPELVTAIIAALKKHADVVIGNILGSNIFNILGILGVTGMVKTIPFAGRIAAIDVWIMLGTAAALLFLIVVRKKLARPEGAAFLALYAGYVFWLFGESA